MKKIITLVLMTLFTQCQAQKTQNIMMPKIDNYLEKITKKFDKSRIDEINNSEHIIYTSANVGFGEAHYFNHSYFIILKNFFKNSIIQNKGVAFTEGSPIGTWYHFDESGNLIKEENTDEGYDFGPLDVVKYCEKNNIKLPKGYQTSGYQTDVYKREIDGRKVWVISYALSINKQSYVDEITLDGKTGKLLNKQRNTYINN